MNDPTKTLECITRDIEEIVRRLNSFAGSEPDPLKRTGLRGLAKRLDSCVVELVCIAALQASSERLFEAIRLLPPNLKMKADYLKEPYCLEVWKDDPHEPRMRSLAGRIECQIV